MALVMFVILARKWRQPQGETIIEKKCSQTQTLGCWYLWSRMLLIMIILCLNKRVTIIERNLHGAKNNYIFVVLIWTVDSNIYGIGKFYTQLNTLEDHSHMAYKWLRLLQIQVINGRNIKIFCVLLEKFFAEKQCG